jgi:hypothetical protein
MQRSARRRERITPLVERIRTIHIIAEATDDGTLPLTRYARAVVTVK